MTTITLHIASGTVTLTQTDRYAGGSARYVVSADADVALAFNLPGADEPIGSITRFPGGRKWAAFAWLTEWERDEYVDINDFPSRWGALDGLLCWWEESRSHGAA